MKWNIKNQCTGGSSLVPLRERWSSKDFKLDKIFNLDIIEVRNQIEIQDYHSLQTWESLRSFYASGDKIPRPGKQFMKPYIFERGIIDEYEAS